LARDKDKKPKRVGGLERDKPILLAMKTLEHRSRARRISRGKCMRGRHGSGRVVAGEEKTLEG
jgi:hypothetical protein